MRVIETPRLRLRWFTPDDAAFICQLLNDEGWLRNIGDRGVRDEAGARRWIEDRLVPPYRAMGFGFWAMERKSDGALVGMCGLIKRDTLPDIDVGYALLPAYRGAGLAREAAAACIDYAVQVLGQRCLLAIVLEANRDSVGLLEALGMRVERRVHWEGEEALTLVMRWDAPSPGPDTDAARIHALVARYYRSLSKAVGPMNAVPALHHHLIPGALLVEAHADGAVAEPLQDFVTRHAAWLEDGALSEFSVAETQADTHIEDGIAQRRSRYRKSGLRGGERFSADGTQFMQFARTAQGWRITGLCWQEAAA